MQQRHFGIGDTIMGMATRKVEEGKGAFPETRPFLVACLALTNPSLTTENQFKKMLEMMTTSPKWTLRPWKATMENQLNSWSMYIPGVSSSSEVKEMKHFKDMIDAMTDEEVDDPLHKLNGPARERIGRATGRTADEVTRLLFFYKQSLIVSTWLQERYDC